MRSNAGASSIAFVFRCTAFDVGIDVALSMHSEVQSRGRISLLEWRLFHL
jgi:hypothetical protein